MNNYNKINSSKACVHPQYELWSKEYLENIRIISDIKKESYKCNNNDLVYASKGYFRFTDKGMQLNLSCKAKPIMRYDDFNVKYGKQYKKLPMNVLIVGFDSTSQLAMQRNLPKSLEVFERHLGAVRLSEYNILGDGTPAALFPLLTGMTEEELPEARVSHPDRVKNIDNFPFIWSYLRKRGYMTQWAEDKVFLGTFSYRLVGFNNQPVDHDQRVLFTESENTHQNICNGNRNTAEEMFDYADQFFDIYEDKPKFSFLFHVELSHDSMTKLSIIDDSLSEFIEMMNVSGKLDNTLMILMSDHGSRYSKFRKTTQGKIEERTPYVALRFPDWFRRRYPEAMRALHDNRQLLTTALDLHTTILEALTYTDSDELRGTQSVEKKQTLLRGIQDNRTCASVRNSRAYAGIDPHWCGCLEWKEESVMDDVVIAAAKFAIEYINNLTAFVRNKCIELTLLKINIANSFKTNSELLKFKNTLDIDGRFPDKDKYIKDKDNTIIYQLTLETMPSRALYELSITLLAKVKGSWFVLKEADISRINKYGSQPDCVAKQYTHLRKYCYCY